ncbi:hypothetical protein [Alcaligenes aquatilis]|jgi:hypothetical protein|uniref:hypothetical protein n=1 Tax=Alcaligenes aquatilis TaxID=323284 RepID=UPI002AA7A7D9|nr:hypothetical protein [Alcaligenes faecalis]
MSKGFQKCNRDAMPTKRDAMPIKRDAMPMRRDAMPMLGTSYPHGKSGHFMTNWRDAMPM